MTVIDVEKQGCNHIELLSYSSKGKKYHLRWIANLNLLEQLDVYKGNDKIINWTLRNISTDSKIIKSYAATILSYQSTDYADIGDNESNPFLAKMIHQGFTQQAISSDGHPNKKHNQHLHNHDH